MSEAESDFQPVSLALVEEHGAHQRAVGFVSLVIASAIFGSAYALGPLGSHGWFISKVVVRLVAIVVLLFGASGAIALWRGLAIGWATRGATSVELYRAQKRFVFTRPHRSVTSASAADFDAVRAARMIAPPEARVIRSKRSDDAESP